MTALNPVRMPPLTPLLGGKKAISCHKDREWFIRAWAPLHTNPTILIDWILYYVGRHNQAGLEWWGYTYRGLPDYMVSDWDYSSGLTIQRFVVPDSKWTQELLDEGKIGPAYGKVEQLEILDKGYPVRKPS